jgi:hypothetical protein
MEPGIQNDALANCPPTLQPRSWSNVADLLTYRSTAHTQTVAKYQVVVTWIKSHVLSQTLNDHVQAVRPDRRCQLVPVRRYARAWRIDDCDVTTCAFFLQYA